MADVVQLRCCYKCPVCKSTEEDEYLICNNHLCPDRQDQGVPVGGDANYFEPQAGPSLVDGFLLGMFVGALLAAIVVLLLCLTIAPVPV